MKKETVAFFILLFLGLFAYLFYRQGTLPFNKTDSSTKIFVISPGDPLQKIVDNLDKEDLIRSKLVFYLAVKQLGLERSIQAGDFRLSPSMNAYEIAKNLTHGTLDVWVTLIEGTRKEEMAQIIGNRLEIPEVEFIQNAEEGYLFPDTYLMPKDATAGSVISILKNNYEQKFTEDMKQKANLKGLSEKEVLTLASIVEKEAKHEADKKIVAGILLKRLDADWPLQVDATIQYALGYQAGEKSWWKKVLSFDDLEIDSPFNSYKNKGLPPTPISNPGLTSITAVVEADRNTPYWYYMSDKNTNMHYEKTIEEHNENIKKYLE
ncbi:endolytic transglycosylase MltG [Candidatus Roizmanbacteria bacterium]|nr:endolytic transglycosylase MltG [Candidatus Roizmanbacteria bacterium]